MKISSGCEVGVMGQKHRMVWLDILKAIGIFEIYMGHFAQSAGHSFSFVFSHHVALFFFVSGCTETCTHDMAGIDYIKKKVKSLLIPFFFFTTLSIIVQLVFENGTLVKTKSLLLLMLQGAIRNQFFASSLWFFTCLFVTSIFFFYIKKTAMKLYGGNFMTLAVCFGMFLIAQYVITPKPIDTPSWIFNIDSAFYYIIFYAIGYVAFPTINNLFQSEHILIKLSVWLSGLGALIYSVCLFFGRDILFFTSQITILNIFYPIFKALIVIWLWICISYALQNMENLAIVGRSTLYLCGSEFIIKLLVPCALSLMGLSITIQDPLACAIYTIILLFLTMKFLLPIERILLTQITGACLFLKGRSKSCGS